MKLGAVRSLPRDLYIAVGAKAVSLMGTEIAVTALLLQFHDRGAGGWAVAGLMVAGTAPTILAAPVVGLMVDRYDSRTLIVASSLWQTCVCTVLAFVGNPVAVLVLVALDALGLAVNSPAVGSLTRLMVSDERLSAATGLQQGGNIVANLAGPTLGGLLFGATGDARVALLVDAGSFLMIALAGLLIRTRRRPSSTGQKFRARDGIVTLFTDYALAPVMVLAVMLIVAGQVTVVAEVFLVRDTFQSSALIFGLLTATWVLGSVFGTMFAVRFNTPGRILRGVPVAAAVMACGVAVTGLSRSLPTAFIMFVFAGAASSVVSVGTGTLVQLRADRSALGRVLASFSGVLQSASLISAGLGGLLIALFAPDIVFTLSGAFSLLAVLATVPAFRRALARIVAASTTAERPM